MINFKSVNKVLIRVDFNVPIKQGKVIDLTRIESAIPTIKYFLDKKMNVFLMSHLGRPLKQESKYSLKQIIPSIEKLLTKKVKFVKDINGNVRNLLSKNKNQIFLLENLRFYSGEKENNVQFAELLSKYGDIYVNDAFGVSHRHHASVSAIGNFFLNKKFKGLLVKKELDELSQLNQNNKRPFTIIVGGSKIGSKIHLLKTFLNKADNILIGGGMAFPFIKFLGGSIGDSIYKESELGVVKSFLDRAQQSKTKIILPTDCIATNDLENSVDCKNIYINNIPDSYMGVDIGKDTIRLFSETIKASKLIMWNGPMGVSEIDLFSFGTRKIAESITQATAHNAYSIVGGGDTVSDIAKLEMKNNFSYISTGGGAMLDFFRDSNLPGILNMKSLKIDI
ncbi:MAG: phosphoglycerate kinase [Flavobacteriales bacterium]|nr:phosphoglycerate kinase [Flavobacteriales bacterium]|tara:strand:- start:7402 stop:8583 length:1182 start_codon:yes stop_codon:yes gene_type:complete